MTMENAQNVLVAAALMGVVGGATAGQTGEGGSSK